jgi:hypothetical protein
MYMVAGFSFIMEENGHHLYDVFENLGGAWFETTPRKM